MYLSPADFVISSFGGVRKLAGILGTSPSTVSRWSTRSNRFGEFGNIPNGMHKTILKKAKKLKVDITATDLVYGRNVKK